MPCFTVELLLAVVVGNAQQFLFDTATPVPVALDDSTGARWLRMVMVIGEVFLRGGCASSVAGTCDVPQPRKRSFRPARKQARNLITYARERSQSWMARSCKPVVSLNLGWHDHVSPLFPDNPPHLPYSSSPEAHQIETQIGRTLLPSASAS